jgi:hypothetical protein
MVFSNRRTRRLYARLWARVKNARTEAERIRARIQFRKRFGAQIKLLPELRSVARKATREAWRRTHPEECKRIQQRSYLNLKARVFGHYTKGAPRCQHPEGCDIIDIDRLQLDHKDADWSKDVWPNGRRITGRNLYLKVEREGFPDGYQVLCDRHNVVKGPRPYSMRNGSHPMAGGTGVWMEVPTSTPTTPPGGPV